MNVNISDIGAGKTTYSIIQSIMRNNPIVCPNEDSRKSLILQGRKICEKLFPNDGRLSMPDPITYKELEEKSFNPSFSYIIDSLDDYFKYKGINISAINVLK